MLKLEAVSTSYGPIKVLRNVSLHAKKGEITCLLGSNGAGKTTTIKTILGLVKPNSGIITLEGRQIQGLKTADIIKAGVAVVPEGRRIFPKMTVYENLLLGGSLIKDKNIIQSNLKKMYDLFPRLAERKNQIAGTMSGGEQQMLAIARALMSNPKLLLLDEPSLGLAPILIKEIFDIIVQINKEGTTVLLIEQNAFKALSISHAAYIMQKGEIVQQSTGQEGISIEEIKAAYLKKQAG
ncbi:MAG TPA: ABC transporter ATP-binding protein [Clostridia bacterium]|nr:ABC transporter ATP-binding protein [Clostridia bacterium]